MLTEKELTKAVDQMAQLPYLRKPYSKRNWGSGFHSLISYQSKLKPAIAFFLARFFTKKDDMVLDPFCGVGTIPFELAGKGVRTVALDINEIAYFSTYAKMNPISSEEVSKQVRSLERFMSKHEVPEDLLEYPDDYTRRFYHDKTLEEILLSMEFFRKNPDLRNSLIKTCILHILHGNRPYALSRRSHNITPYAPTGDFEYRSLKKSLRQKVKRVFSGPWPHGFQKGDVLLGSILGFDQYTDSLDAVITSPPFVNSTRFLYNNRIRLWYLGQSYEEQMKQSGDYLDCMTIEDYEKVVSVFNKVLKKDGLCILHLGIVKKIDMARRISEMANRRGFETRAVIDEDVSSREKFGIKDQGATHTHQFLVLRKIDSLYHF